MGFGLGQGHGYIQCPPNGIDSLSQEQSCACDGLRLVYLMPHTVDANWRALVFSFGPAGWGGGL